LLSDYSKELGRRKRLPHHWPLVAVVVAIDTVPVPLMVVGDLAALAIPVACIVALSVVTRFYPMCARISGTGPVSAMPPIMAAHRIPVAPYPEVSDAWTSRLNPHYAYRWGRADSHPDGKLSEDSSCR